MCIFKKAPIFALQTNEQTNERTNRQTLAKIFPHNVKKVALRAEYIEESETEKTIKETSKARRFIFSGLSRFHGLARIQISSLFSFQNNFLQDVKSSIFKKKNDSKGCSLI